MALPLALPLISAGIQLGGGIMSLVKGNKQAREASALKQQRDAALAAIPLEDPRQVQILEEVRRRRRAFETGTAFESQLRNLRSAQTGTQQNILRAAGGAGGAAIGGLSRTQLAVGRGISDIGRTSMQAQLSLTDRIAQQSNLITKRKDQLQLGRFGQLSAEAAQKEKEANANRNAGQAQLLSAGGALVGGALSGLNIGGGDAPLGTTQSGEGFLGLNNRVSNAPIDVSFDTSSDVINTGLNSPQDSSTDRVYPQLTFLE